MSKITIKELRLRRGMSQRDLSRVIGVHVNAIQRWETGKTGISDLSLYKVAAFFGVDPKNISN